jgi:hypothetical protein
MDQLEGAAVRWLPAGAPVLDGAALSEGETNGEAAGRPQASRTIARSGTKDRPTARNMVQA